MWGRLPFSVGRGEEWPGVSDTAWVHGECIVNGLFDRVEVRLL